MISDPGLLVPPDAAVGVEGSPALGCPADPEAACSRQQVRAEGPADPVRTAPVKAGAAWGPTAHVPSGRPHGTLALCEAATQTLAGSYPRAQPVSASRVTNGSPGCAGR